MPEKYINLENLGVFKEEMDSSINEKVSTKQDTINDLDTIRSGATAGSTAVQPEAGKGLSTNDYTDQEKSTVASALQPSDAATSADILALFGIPSKGDIIDIDIYGNNTTKRFRVLSVNRKTVVLLGLENLTKDLYDYNSVPTVKFDNGNNYTGYENSVLDRYLNETYYNSLSNDIKNAIIDVNLIQSAYSETAVSDIDTQADFNMQWQRSGGLYSYSRISQKTVGMRHCYACDIDMLVDYFELQQGDLLDSGDLMELFLEYRTYTDSSPSIWFTTAKSVWSGEVEALNGYQGGIAAASKYNNQQYRPVFKIDLTNIDFTIEGGNN